jgi:hypothetical protein
MINGAPVANSDEAGRISLGNDDRDHVYLGDTSALTYSVTVVPGAYDVYYSWSKGTAVAPMNANTKLRCFDTVR